MCPHDKLHTEVTVELSVRVADVPDPSQTCCTMVSELEATIRAMSPSAEVSLPSFL